MNWLGTNVKAYLEPLLYGRLQCRRRLLCVSWWYLPHVCIGRVPRRGVSFFFLLLLLSSSRSSPFSLFISISIVSSPNCDVDPPPRCSRDKRPKHPRKEAEVRRWLRAWWWSDGATSSCIPRGWFSSFNSSRIPPAIPVAVPTKRCSTRLFSAGIDGIRDLEGGGQTKIPYLEYASTKELASLLLYQTDGV